MTITVDDVKLLKSQRLTDESDGGGRATGESVVDGEVNNLFPDISRLDRTLGRISLRKAFAGVLTSNADAYLGAHAIVSKPPADPRVSVLLFNSNSQTDERADAQSVIEGYVVPSTPAQFDLLGDQFAGQRAITVVQRLPERVPQIGDVFQLSSGINTQYVRVTSVETEETEFVIDANISQGFLTVTRRRIELGISSALLYKFPGGQVTAQGTSNNNTDGQAKAAIRGTQVADSARYFGINALAQPIAEGDLDITVNSIYSQLVPSAMREQALTTLLAGGLQRDMIETAEESRTVSLSFTNVGGNQSRAFVTTGVSREGATLSLDGGVYADNGTGELSHESGNDNFDLVSIEYETGEVNLYRKTGNYSGTGTLEYTPAVASIGPVVSSGIEVTLASRGYVYTLNLAEVPPRPGTLIVSYLVMGRWYDLRDAGNGELQGEGAGSVNYATGAVTVTLSALPDVGTQIVYAFVTQLSDNIKVHAGASPAITRQIVYKASELLDPDATTVTVVEDEQPVERPATIIRDVVYIDSPRLPDPGTDVTVDYSPPGRTINTPLTGGVPDAGGMLSGTIPDAPLQPGSVDLDWLVIQKAPVPKGQSGGATVSKQRSVKDDGSGGWAGRLGSINYTTGVFSIQVTETYQWYYYSIVPKGAGYENKMVSQTQNESFGGTLNVTAVGA